MTFKKMTLFAFQSQDKKCSGKVYFSIFHSVNCSLVVIIDCSTTVFLSLGLVYF